MAADDILWLRIDDDGRQGAQKTGLGGALSNGCSKVGAVDRGWVLRPGQTKMDACDDRKRSAWWAVSSYTTLKTRHWHWHWHWNRSQKAPKVNCDETQLRSASS
jgi:hypothetical protein